MNVDNISPGGMAFSDKLYPLYIHDLFCVKLCILDTKYICFYDRIDALCLFLLHCWTECLLMFNVT